jgi:hypothetical protein
MASKSRSQRRTSYYNCRNEGGERRADPTTAFFSIHAGFNEQQQRLIGQAPRLEAAMRG